jgi:hypothetical protein
MRRTQRTKKKQSTDYFALAFLAFYVCVLVFNLVRYLASAAITG